MDEQKERAEFEAWCDANGLLMFPDLWRAWQARAALAAAPAPAKPNSDWRKPTAFRERFAQAVALLCGTRAPADMIDGWLDDADDRLQGFAAQHGPAWAQGIVLLDAAHVLAATPTDGVDHEAAPPAQHPDTADAERMQWLEDYCLAFDCIADPDSLVKVWHDTEHGPTVARTLRAAIDAARAQAQKGQ